MSLKISRSILRPNNPSFKTCTMILNRYSASFIHLLLSLLVFLSLVAVMYFYWFPGDLFFMDGGWQGIKLVAMVDLILGPLLTLFLFKRGKKNLVLDMSAIACLQIAALAYGFYATYNQRIVGMVFADNRFNTLTITEHRSSSERLKEKGIEPVAIESFGKKSPVTVYTEPFDKFTYGIYLESIFNDFPAIRERSDKYLPISEHLSDLAAMQLRDYDLESSGQLQRIQEMLADNGFAESTVELYPLKARYESGIAVFDPATQEIVDVLRHPDFSKIGMNRVAVSSEE